MTAVEQQALNARNGSGSAVQTKESGGSGAKVEATTGLASTADAVNRKADVAFGRTEDVGHT